MRKAVLPAIIFLLLITSFITHGKATIYDVRDGLSSNDIVKIVKDDRGLMWIGTFNGLNIYDGYTFTRIPGILANKHITALTFHEATGEILAGTETGLYIIDIPTLQTTLATPGRKAETSWSAQRVDAIFAGKGCAYIAFSNGYLARRKGKGKLELLCRLPESGKRISGIVSDDKGLIVNNEHLYRIDLEQKQAIPITDFGHASPVTAIDRCKNLLLINRYAAPPVLVDIHTFTDSMPDILRKSLSNQQLPITRCLLKERLLYTLGNNYSFSIIDIYTGKVSEVSRKYPEVFEGKVYYSIFIDEHSIIWIATNKGLIKIEDRPELFTRELYNFPSRVSTRKMIEDDNGDIYVASYNGLWRLSHENGQWENYFDSKITLAEAGAVTYKGGVIPMALQAVRGSNYIYVGFDSDYLLRFDKRKKTFETIAYTKDLKGQGLGGVYSIVTDHKGILWLGCGNGLASYDPASSKLVLHRKDAFDIGAVRVRYLSAGAGRDTLYAATVSGLYVVDLVKGMISRLTTTTRPALSNNDVLFAEPDADRNIWLGTNGSGINIVSPDLGKVQYIRRRQGLSNEIVYSVLWQNQNTLWISTFNGLDRYRRDQQSFSNFFEEDGLSSNEFNQNSFLKTSDGKMLFGSINGITSFNPELFSSPEPFKVFCAGVSRWDEKTQSLQLSRNKLNTDNKIIKKPSDLLLEVHFSCTDYTDPTRNSYSYHIRELSDNWVALEDRHTLNLGGIPYGDYTIEVKAINSRGVSSSNILTFHVKVVQPFYRTWWFFALLLCGLALIFYIAYQIKYQGFKNILHLRMKIASNLHDEVGSLLTRITMFSENLRYGRNTEEQRNTKLEKIAMLSRDAITSMSDVLWTIDSRNDFAGNLLDRMREHAEEMLTPLGIDVNFVLSGTDLNQPISSDTRGEIYLIFKEAINNIAKHSEATRVEITYRIDERSFLLRITNNKAQEKPGEWSTGQGLSNMEMRAARIKAAVAVEAADGYFTVEVKK